MLKGILIIINGHPQYGRLAYNLCMSIKAAENFPVAVAGDQRAISHLSDNQKYLFDEIIELPEGLPVSSGVKLWANELTPFEETLVLDADMLWLPYKKPSELFEEVKEVDFTAITEGYYSVESDTHEIHPMYFFWADPKEIIEKFGITKGKIYQWRSEVMYFKKTDKVQEFFALARDIYENPKLSTLKKYAEGVPDELGVNVSAAVHDIHPHVYKWMPSYWNKMFNNQIPAYPQLYDKYYLMSFGSNTASTVVKKFYDRIMKAAAYKLGLQHLFTLQSKRDYLPERIKG